MNDNEILNGNVVGRVSAEYITYRGKERVLADMYLSKSNEWISSNTPIKKVAMFYYRLSIGGVQRVISLLTPMFIELGYEVVFITESIAEDFDYDLPESVEVITIPTEASVLNTGNYHHRAAKLQEIINEKGIDVVCYHAASSPILLYDLLMFKLNSVKFIAIKHELFSQYMAYRNDILFTQEKVFRLLDRLVVLGQDECNFWNILGVKAEYINNPMGDYVLSDGNVDGEKYILWLGRLEKIQKQCMDIVLIMKEVVKNVPDAVLKIYGNEVTHGVVSELSRAIEKENLENNVIYCGYVNEHIADVYSHASVFLVTSSFESSPLTIFESKKSGVPLVTYDMPYLSLLKEKKGFIAVENDNIKAAADAIVKLLKDDDLRNKLSKEAKESVAGFSNNKIKDRWEELFKNISEKPNEKNEVYKAEDMRTILHTILYHYHKGIVFEGKKSVEKVAEMSDIASVIRYYVQRKHLPVAIYPFGKKGQYVKEILNKKLNIKEALIVDNNLSKIEGEIKSIDDLKEIDCTQFLFFICSNSTKYYEEIRKEIHEVVPNENIVDLFL